MPLVAAATPLESAQRRCAEGMSGLAAVVVGALLGEYSLLIVPFIVTAMMQGYGISEERAGDLVSVQLLTMGVAGFIGSYLTTRVSARAIMIMAYLLIMAANAMCAVTAIEPVLWAGRALTGLGEGSLMAAAGAIAAGVRDPHRLFSALGLAIAVVAALALLAAPVLFTHLGPRSVFWLLVASPCAGLASARWLPGGVAPPDGLPRLGALAMPGALPALIAFGLLWVGASALWVFAERIGAAQHLSLEQVGSFLAIGQVVGILGPLVAARYGQRLGLRTSLAAGSAVMAAAGLVMVYGHGAWPYAAGASFLSLAVMFLAPCFRSLMAALDTTGSVVAMSVTFYTFGFGAAPLLVAGLRTDGYGNVAWLAATAFVASGVLACLPQPNRPVGRSS